MYGADGNIIAPAGKEIQDQADWRIDEAKGGPYAMVFREHLPS